MSELSDDKRNGITTRPKVWYPVSSGSWVESFSQTTKQLGRGVTLFHSAFRLELLRRPEMGFPTESDNTATRNLIRGLRDDRLLSSTDRIRPIPVRKLMIKQRKIEPWERFVQFNVIPNQRLQDARARICEIVLEETGRVIKGPDEFPWDVVAAVVRDGSPLSNKEIAEPLGEVRPRTITVLPPAVILDVTSPMHPAQEA